MKNRLKLFPMPFLAVAVMVASTPSAFAASGDTIGEAIEVINLVTADYSRDKRTLQPGDDVRQDEKIAVGSDGRSELQFADETKIALGPGSEMLLDKFVYDSDKNSGSIVMDLVSGTLRFITGVAQKPTYVIRTPNASITVRGTIFDVYTPPKGGPTYLLLHEGGVKVCSRKRKTCRNNNNPSRLVRISKNGKIDNPTVWSVLEGKDGIPFDLAFPFVINPPLIDPSPVFSKGDIINAALPKKYKPKKVYKKKAQKKKTQKKKVTKKKTKPTKKYVKKKKKWKNKKANNDAAKAAAAIAIIGLGIALKNKGGKKGGGGGCRGRKCGGGGSGGGGGRHPYDY